MTRQELNSLIDLIDQKLDLQKCAVHETEIGNIKDIVIEVRNDVKYIKDNHSNRLTKLETEKKTTIAVVGALVAFLFSIVNLFK